MFTGLIEGIGCVKDIFRKQDDMTIGVQPLFEMNDCKVGESISVDGVCLTITQLKKNALFMDVSGETLSRSTLTFLKHGTEVNLERALRLTDRLGGHLVSGHIDGIGKIIKSEHNQRHWQFNIEVDESISHYIVEKGSIAVDGISLTVNSFDKNRFNVNIVPQTGELTTILQKKMGDFVNIETDLIGKYIEKLLSKGNPEKDNKRPVGIDMELLKRHGFGD
jgi:riboflavin synthase